MTAPPSSNSPLAVGLALIAAALLAGTTLLAKALGTDALGPALHPLQISQGRFMFALAAVVAFVGVTRRKFRWPNLKFHVLRSGIGWGGVTLMFAAAAFIPL